MVQTETVYIAMRGENYEGGHILGVYADKTDAEDRVEAEKQKQGFVGCDWAEVQDYEVVRGDSR